MIFIFVQVATHVMSRVSTLYLQSVNNTVFYILLLITIVTEREVLNTYMLMYVDVLKLTYRHPNCLQDFLGSVRLVVVCAYRVRSPTLPPLLHCYQNRRQ